MLTLKSVHVLLLVHRLFNNNNLLTPVSSVHIVYHGLLLVNITMHAIVVGTYLIHSLHLRISSHATAVAAAAYNPDNWHPAEIDDTAKQEVVPVHEI